MLASKPIGSKMIKALACSGEVLVVKLCLRNNLK